MGLLWVENWMDFGNVLCHSASTRHYIVMAYIVMAHVSAAYVVMACIDTAYIVTACIVMAQVVMAYVVAYVVVASSVMQPSPGSADTRGCTPTARLSGDGRGAGRRH